MPSIPISIVATGILVWLLARGLIQKNRPMIFLMLLALCAAQGVIVAGSLHYQITFARLIQPITAACIPPLAWAAFIATSQRSLTRADAVHWLGPAFVVFCVVFVPNSLDFVIPCLYLGYAVVLWRSAAADLPRLRLVAGDRSKQVWQLIALALAGSAAADVLIVGVQMLGLPHLVAWIVALTSSLTLLLIGGLALSPALDPTKDEPPLPEICAAADADLLADLEALLAREQLHLDPDLSLNRLARRLHVPAKRLSVAINRGTGGNVSRLINRRRIDVACAQLTAGQNVTEAMLAAGFNTKSNFNRAFLLATGQTPTEWRDTAILRQSMFAPTLLE